MKKTEREVRKAEEFIQQAIDAALKKRSEPEETTCPRQ